MQISDYVHGNSQDYHTSRAVSNHARLSLSTTSINYAKINANNNRTKGIACSSGKVFYTVALSKDTDDSCAHEPEINKKNLNKSTIMLTLWMLLRRHTDQYLTKILLI